MEEVICCGIIIYKIMEKKLQILESMVGFIIGFFATAFGITTGILFSYYIENIRQFLSEAFNLSLFPEEIYFLNKMPSEINFESIFLIGLCSIIVTSIVSIFPAIKASKMDPVKSLKYE